MEKHRKNKETDILIGISLGDINGIGPEVIIKALSDARISKLFTPVIYGSGKILAYYKKAIENTEFQFFQAKSIQQISPRKINLINCWEDHVDVNPGQSTAEGGKRALQSLEAACADLASGSIDALVTAPINKHNIQSDEFKFPGHTEYLAEKFGKGESLMFLVSEGLRIGVATGHIPIQKISENLNQELIEKKLGLMIESLKGDFGIKKPRLAVLGLNPHAGEDGLLGSEEQDIIIPAIASLKKKGELVFGPFPADGFFGTSAFKKFDGILAMYHDQGLIPFKHMAFDSGVNFTAGLPIVRTSPDHGTAYDIAGKALASEESFRAALFLAADIAKNRAVWE
jgi:4-hydroxythreonine-4-phosphate dehydrogenase